MAVSDINCHIPTAFAGDITLGSRLLSIHARYLKSSGTPFAFRIGSITGKKRLARFKSNNVDECIYIIESISRSKRSRISVLCKSIFWPQKLT